jgi:hypothetical protein
VNIFVVEDVDGRDGNGASQLDKNASIANSGFLNIFGRDCVIGVGPDDNELVDENFSLFDFNTISCFAFLTNSSSYCK